MYKIRVYVDLDWVGPGMSGAAVFTQEANNPAFGATTMTAAAPGSGGSAQSLRMQVAEQIVTTTPLSALTQAQFNTAINQAATDLQTILATANSTGVTNLAQAQSWATGGT